jgi:hypothetical protein
MWWILSKLAIFDLSTNILYIAEKKGQSMRVEVIEIDRGTDLKTCRIASPLLIASFLNQSDLSPSTFSNPK